MTRRRLVRTFWIGAAAILVAAALVALAAVVKGDFSDTDGQILFTLAALLYTGGAALAGLALVDRDRARPLGWTVVAAALTCLVLVVWAIWSFVDEQNNEPQDKLAWSSVLVVLAGLIASTGLLLARKRALVVLAAAAGALAALAAALSIVGVWTEPDSDWFIKVVAALWILTALAYFLVPVLQRFSGAGEEGAPERVLAELDGVELVATRTGDGLEARLDPGERLLLRRRC